jgi:hypothetical protein
MKIIGICGQFLCIHKMLVKGSLCVTAYNKGEVSMNKIALSSARKLGEKIVKSIKC